LSAIEKGVLVLYYLLSAETRQNWEAIQALPIAALTVEFPPKRVRKSARPRRRAHPSPVEFSLREMVQPIQRRKAPQRIPIYALFFLCKGSISTT
jgi:hypothetical protein